MTVLQMKCFWECLKRNKKERPERMFIMKKMRSIIMFMLAAIIMCISVTAFASSAAENPYKGHYAAEAAELRTPGTAKCVYLFLDEQGNILPGVKMIYNSTKARNLEAVADEKGMLIFPVKESELFYIREAVYNNVVKAVSGEDVINNIEKNDVRKGKVFWNCIVMHDNVFMTYRGD